MVLINCRVCTDYWLENGRHMDGYDYLSRDLHIPMAHLPHMQPVVGRKFRRSYDSEVEGCDDREEEGQTDEKGMENVVIDTSWYFLLYKAAMHGDWETGKQIFDTYGTKALRAKIRGHSETALHVAIHSCRGRQIFVKKLLKLLSEEDLEVKTSYGCTSLAIAAKVGNVEAAELLVKKHKRLLYIPDANENFPIHNAAECGQKEMLLYLLEATEEGKNPDPYDPQGRGPKLLNLIIKAEFFDVALHLLERMPELATSGMEPYKALCMLAQNPSAFSCWKNEGVFHRLIYTCMPNPQKNKPYLSTASDVESPANKENLSCKSHLYFQTYVVPGLKKIHNVIWMIFERTVPLLNRINCEMLKGYQAKKLVKCLCRDGANNLQQSSDVALLFKIPLFLAAENGIHEIVKEITYSFPDAIWYNDDNNNSEVFRLAIQNRHHEVYNLLYEMGDLYINIVRQSVENGDSILHLAGYLAPSVRLRVVSGAALQMQRELQWFKEIESLVQPAYKSKRNNEGKTPQEVFTESHQKLTEDGERWMKDTANSCTVAATLVATIAFTAALTVPGGTNENGSPMLGSEKAFLTFGAADALSLITSFVSILMFLSIHTARYAEGDFLQALPTRLIIGLLSLFISIASMMAAFNSMLYQIFRLQRRWILGYALGPFWLIATIYASMQVSLLAEMVISTYRCPLFKRRCKSKSPINQRGFVKKEG